jgi:hypothetical protein
MSRCCLQQVALARCYALGVSNGTAEVVRVGSRHRNDSQLRSATSSAKQTSDRADTAIAHHVPP